jgi:hypothetical protein
MQPKKIAASRLGNRDAAVTGVAARASSYQHNATAAGGSKAAWTTRLLPEFTREYGVEEVHAVCFEPEGWPGTGPTIALGIPECELQLCFRAADGEPVVTINRPQRNLSVKRWLRTACEMATEHRCFLILNCDTAEQAAVAARKATRLLPHHRRAALERMYDPASRVRGGLT